MDIRLPSASCLCPAVLLFVAASLTPTGSAWGAGESTTTGVSRAFNPALSLNGLFLFGLDTRSDTESDELTQGIEVQEVEMRLTSTIDAYSKADASLSFSNDEIAFEEVYIRSSVLGHGIGLRAGRFYVPYSIENSMHTHQLPFLRRTLQESSVATENYRDTGLELSWLAPTSFYLEASTALLDGNLPGWFDSSRSKDYAYHGRLSALVDLGEATTASLGGGVVTGRNSRGGSSTLSSVAFTLRWRPLRRAIYHSFHARAEYTYADRTGTESYSSGGFDSILQYQFGRRWWSGLRYDNLDPSDQDQNSWRWSTQIAFVPSEFQVLRAELSSVHTPNDQFREFFLQYNFTIGSHPAHRY